MDLNKGADTAPSPGARLRTEQRVVVDTYIDLTLSAREAAALRAALRLCTGHGEVADDLANVLGWLMLLNEHLPKLGDLVITPVRSAENRPMLSFAPYVAGGPEAPTEPLGPGVVAL